MPIVGQKTAKNQLNILPYFGKVLLAVCLFFNFLGGVRWIVNNFICVYQVYDVYLYCN